MANCLKTISYNVVIGAFVASAIVSISISGWQYTSNDNGNRWTLNGEEVDFVKDICGGWPYEYIRPFSVSCDGCDKPSYCGYNDGSTGYRIGIAGATGIIAILMALKKFDDQPFALWITLLLNAVFWGAAFVIDCAIVSNAALACTNSAAWANDEKCSNTKYGITIAIDLVLVIVTTLAWLALAGFSPMGEKAAAAAATRASFSSTSGTSAKQAYGVTTQSYADQL